MWKNTDFSVLIYGKSVFYILLKRKIMTIPIWKDKVIDLGAYESMDFCIKVGGASGEMIYRGKAHRRPGETHIFIKINDICADYLHNTLPTLSQAKFTELSFPVKFYIQRWINNAWVSVDTAEFINDWSYDDSYNPATMGMSFPINGRIDSRQWITYTALNASSITAILTFADGTTSQVIIPVEISADFSDDFNDDFARSARAAGSGTAVFDLSAWNNVASVTINGKSWKVASDCREWAFYYVNAYGGWDTFLIEGNSMEKDNITRHTRAKEYDNRDIKNRGMVNYVNEISKTYTMHTSWLPDNESLRMHHLLNSPEVYLYNINSGEMIPVVLNNSSTEYRTYKNNGGRMVNYTIEATLAQDRIRR